MLFAWRTASRKMGESVGFSTREQNVDFSLRFEGHGLFKERPHILHIQLVNEASSVRIHIAG